MLTHLDLFSGIGGFALAAKWAGFRTVGFCEIEPYCQRVLAKNFGAEVMADSQHSERRAEYEINGNSHGRDRLGRRGQIVPDIFTLDGTRYRGVTLLTGGFPCQPFSVAGKRRGAADDRHLWPEMLRVIAEARPSWVLGENVPGIIPMELDNVLSQLEAIGYACRPFVIPACAVDARHRRDRLWIVGRRFSSSSVPERAVDNRRCTPGTDSKRDRGSVRPEQLRAAEVQFLSGAPVSDSNGTGCREQRRTLSVEEEQPATECPCRWLPEPDVGRVAHGIPARVDRLRGLGNAIVPQVAFEILAAIAEIERSGVSR